jgi:hypothetical protein
MKIEDVTPWMRKQILESKLQAATLAKRFGITVEQVLDIWESAS